LLVNNVYSTKPRRMRVNREPPSDGTFLQGILELLLEITKEFPLSKVKDEPSDAPRKSCGIFASSISF
jgi:hypothetical protein